MVQKYPKKFKKIAGVVVIHPDSGKLLVMKRDDGKWDLPKGHVEEGEQIYDAACRECEEETGLDVEVHPYTCVTSPSKSLLTFFLGLHHGDEDDVELSHEHVYYEWIRPSEAVRLFGRNHAFTKMIKAICVLL